MAEQEILQLILSELKDVKTGQSKLVEGQERLEAGQERLEARQEKLEAGQERLEARQSKLEDSYEKLEDSYERLEARQEKLEEGQDRLRSDVQVMIEQQSERFEGEILGLKVMIENNVTKRIDSLFDGYKLNHEKQWDLERRVEVLEERLGIAL